MPTINRGYPELPANVNPDVPHYVNLALRKIDTDVELVELKAESAVLTAAKVKAAADSGAYMGLPGINGLPAAQAVAAYLESIGSPAREVLRRSVEQEVKVAAAPMVRGVGIGRIIVTQDADETAQDGDLLFLLESPKYFCDFSQYAVGSTPNDWTRRWAADPFTVEEAPGATGGKVLRQVSSGQGRRALSWNAVAPDAARTADVEVVFKWRAEGQGGLRAVMRGSGAVGKENGIGMGHNDSGGLTIFNSYVNGAAGSIGSTHEYPYVPGNWYITRARAVGDRLSARTWAATDPEPAAWTGIATQTAVQGAGWVGLMPFGTGVKEYDWIGVAFDGGQAPVRGL